MASLGRIVEVSVLAEMQNEIRAKGPLTFARFMEMALYSRGGYYERQKQIGKGGDFYTSVSVGPLFGELVARQLSVWLEETSSTDLVEVGAHDGALARDILAWFSANKTQVRYTIVEPSAARRGWQRQTLQNHTANVRWVEKVPMQTHGIVFSNELLDAMPVHRLCWHAKSRDWKEWFVGCDNGAFVWKVSEVSAPATACLPIVTKELAEVLPDGFSTEVSPAAIHWWTEAARSLQRGYLVAIDYGLTEQEFFRPDRVNGTARGYSKHRISDDLLANPGEQDITAHVNWTAIQAAGERAGLRTIQFCSQEKFVMEIVKLAAAENWTAEQIRQLKTLTHPNFLGRAFRVLVQKRD